MAILVRRLVVTPLTDFPYYNRPYVLRVCFNNPNVNPDRAVQYTGLPVLPYTDNRGRVCFEYDYRSPKADAEVSRLIERSARAYANDPYLVAVEGVIVGQWGEGTCWQLSMYRGSAFEIPWDVIDVLRWNKELAAAFPDKPFMVRTLDPNPYDSTQFPMGGYITNNTYDDVLYDTQSFMLQEQIYALGAQNAMHGGEVSGNLQHKILKDPRVLYDRHKKLNRKLHYVCEFWARPSSLEESKNLEEIYEFFKSI